MSPTDEADADTVDTVGSLVAARRSDTNIGLRFEDRAWTWADVVREAATRAAVLDAMRRDGPFHVGVLLENVPEFVFMLAGAALCGAAVVGINPTRRGEELAADIRHTDCQFVVTDEAQAPLLAGLDLGSASGRALTIESASWQAHLRAHRDAPLPARLPDASTLFVLVFTSGSTGAPKAVRGTQGRYATFGPGMGFGPDDVCYCSMPLFHGNALSANFMPAVRSGATIALRRKFSASEFFADVRRFDVSYFNLVGRALSYILATPPSASDRDHRVKFALAPESSAADADAFRERFGIAVVGGYGSSEGAIIIRPIAGGKPGALGRPAPGTDVAVVDPATGDECPPAEFDEHGRLENATAAIGELVRRDPNLVFEGYYDNAEATAERSRNGWYWSGDLAYRDHDGVFYFAGRTADWLRVDGENFAAAPVERIIGRHPGIAAVAVYAVPDPVTGDQVMAAIEVRAGTTFDPGGFADFLDTQPDLGTKWAPRFVRVVDALPTTGADKLDKKPLRAWAFSLAPGPVWWRPQRDRGYEPLTSDQLADLEARFRDHRRADLLPG
jgi:steroid-22-oyl-CoA synthetase